MLFTEFYLYLYIVFIWIIYIFNSFYQNHKMKHFWPNTKKEILTIPFYIFIYTSFLILIRKILFVIFEQGVKNSGTIIDFASTKRTFFSITIIVGIIFCFISTCLYFYVNFFEKSFPSCLALKNGKQLKGIYNYVRHPSYHIISFITFGTTLCLLNFTLFILACINHISLYFYYMIEENQIRKTNSYYNEYLKKTKRFLPNLSKLSSNQY